MSRLTDQERANLLGISLEAYYKLSPPDDHHLIEQEISKASHSMDGMDYRYYDELGDANVPVRRGNPHSDTDRSTYDHYNVDIYWDHAPATPEEKSVFYGYHVHSKDNPYGLHTHIPGGKLGGAHTHGPENRRGSHTHAVDIEKLSTNYLIHPNAPVYIDGEHMHMENFPDGPHRHSAMTFAPSEDS